MTFADDVIKKTVEKLLAGKDYREEVVNSINAIFFDFTIDFFKKIVEAKMDNKEIDLKWYSDYFINSENFSPEEAAIYAGVNKKTITNMYGTATKQVVIDVANSNFKYLDSLVTALKDDSMDGLAITIKISYNNVMVDLSLKESLLVINALATKKIQIRGGAWSSIGKKVEKPLIDKLCDLTGVCEENRNNKHFIKDKNKAFDREVDYVLYGADGKEYRIEVKLMGKGNPESADATIARDSDIFVADTLSEQNCNQLTKRGVKYLILKNNKDAISAYAKIMDELKIPRKISNTAIE